MSRQLRTFRLEGRPDIAIGDDGGVSFVSGGAVCRLSMRIDGDYASIVVRRDGDEFELTRGGTREVIETYLRLTREMVGGRLWRLALLASAAMIAAAVIGYGIGAWHAGPVGGPASAITRSDVATPGPDFDIPAILREEMRRRAMEAGHRGGTAGEGEVETPRAPDQEAGIPSVGVVPPQAMKALEPFAKGTAILPRPDILRIPETLPTIPEVEPDADADEGNRAAEPGALASAASEGRVLEPVPLPDLASAEARIAAMTDELERSVKEAAAAPAPDSPNAAAAAGARHQETPMSGNDEPPPGHGLHTTAADGRLADGTDEAKPPMPAGEGAASDHAASARAVPANDPSVTKPGQASVQSSGGREDLAEAVNNLVRKGLTADDGMRILAELEKLASENGEITEDMLRDMPHEIAKIIVDAGLVSPSRPDPDAPGGIPYRIINLPESIMSKHRGKDGIADIPDRNTWASRGNYVMIPLPGGGDIRTPEDIKAFGLQP